MRDSWPTILGLLLFFLLACEVWRWQGQSCFNVGATPHIHPNMPICDTQYTIDVPPCTRLLIWLCPAIGTHLCESGCEMALTSASTAVSKSSGSGRATKQSCTRPSLSLSGTSSSTQDDRQRSTRAFTAPGLSVRRNSCCSSGHTEPHSRPRAPRTWWEE